MSLPSLILSQLWSTTGRKKGEEARGPTRLGRRRRVRVQAAPLLLPHGRPAVGGERAGGEGRSPHGAAVRRRRQWSGVTMARRGVPMQSSVMDLDVAPATTSAARRWPDRSTPDGAAAQRPSCLLLLQRARAQGSGGGGAGGEGRRWARCAREGGRRGRWSQPDKIRATIGGESLCCLTTTGTTDQRDPPGILRGRCPRRRSISPGAARRRRLRKPRSKH